jgi:DNA polymerase-3 subunit alpha
VASLAERKPGEIVTLGGVVSGLYKRVTRKGQIMVTLLLEDLSGASVEVVVFPTTYEQYAEVIEADAILLIKGRVDQDVRDDSIKLSALELSRPRLDERPFEIRLQPGACTPQFVGRLKDVLADHPGTTQVFLHLASGAKTTVLRLGSEFCVDTDNGLHAELKATLGSGLSIA